MSRGDYYGKIGVAGLSSEIKTIWYSRHNEPEPCEPIDIYWPTTTDPDVPVLQDFARRLVEITPLTRAESGVVAMCVLDNCTLREAGKEFGFTQERARQVLNKAMRKFRTHQRALTGIEPWELEAGAMLWS